MALTYLLSTFPCRYFILICIALSFCTLIWVISENKLEHFTRPQVISTHCSSAGRGGRVNAQRSTKSNPGSNCHLCVVHSYLFDVCFQPTQLSRIPLCAVSDHRACVCLPRNNCLELR